jgi:hypothetical protein
MTNAEPYPLDTHAAFVPMDGAAAVELDTRIRTVARGIGGQLELLAKLIAEAKEGQIHVSLGFASWTAYLANALAGHISVSRDDRHELVHLLADEGMSQRAISKATGAGKTTIQRELSGGPNGPPEWGKPAATPIVTTKEKGPPTSIRITPRTRVEDRVDLDATPVTTGMDDKVYKRPAPKLPRVKTLPEQVEGVASNLRRNITDLERLLAGPDFKRHRTDLPIEHLRELRDRLTAAIDSIRAD